MPRTGVSTVKRTVPLKPPTAPFTLHAMGDVHFGSVAAWRPAKTTTDSLKATMPTPNARVVLGDLTNNGIGAEDTSYLAWEATLTGAPFYKVLGNHDVQADVRTPEQAAAALGMTARNYTADLGDVLLVGLFPGDSYTAYNSGSRMSPASLTWLDDTLAAATKDCWIACHFPLYDTVGGVGATQFLSTDSGFYIASTAVTASSADVLAILNSRTRAKLWLSGHTHSNINTPGLVGVADVGDRNIATVNASALVSVDRAGSPVGPINAAWLTRNADSIDVRWRAHGGGNWTAPTTGSRVTNVPT